MEEKIEQYNNAVMDEVFAYMKGLDSNKDKFAFVDLVRFSVDNLCAELEEEVNGE